MSLATGALALLSLGLGIALFNLQTFHEETARRHRRALTHNLELEGEIERLKLENTATQELVSRFRRERDHWADLAADQEDQNAYLYRRLCQEEIAYLETLPTLPGAAALDRTLTHSLN